MAKYVIPYAVLKDEEVLFQSEVEVSFTKKDFTEMEEFVKSHNYSWESVDIPGHMYDKCVDKAWDKALSEYPDCSYPENNMTVSIGIVIPQSLLEQLSEDTQEKVMNNIPEEYKEYEEEDLPKPAKEKTLSLIIKQKYFDEIIAGTKTQEFREVKPTTIKQLLQLDEEGFEIEDEFGNAQPIQYDAIRFYVGYNKDRDSALVEVKDSYCEMFTEDVTDENGNVLYFKADKNGELAYFKFTEDGQPILDENGNFVECADDEEGSPITVDDGEEGVTMQLPITYEYKGDTWVKEQVVFNLGKVLEVHKK